MQQGKYLPVNHSPAFAIPLTEIPRFLEQSNRICTIVKTLRRSRTFKQKLFHFRYY
ncbi:MAG TPA: hypothetical protein V6D09_06585 [Leptolyngbyaceae cyanobacterium]